VGQGRPSELPPWRENETAAPGRSFRIVSVTTDQSWSGRAFGLAIDSEFALPGLRAGASPADAERSLSIGLLPTAALGETGGGPVRIDRGPDGYMFVVAGVGRFELSASGRRVQCRPVPAAGWEWRRYLLGQVLPFAALLQGLEVFHASAVEIDGMAVALSGSSGLGKSALALELHLAGAGFVTDDVLAVEHIDGTVMAHPGIALSKVRRRIAGGVLEVRRPVVAVAEPLPLAAFCFLHPSDDDEPSLSERVADARWLLGSTFNLVVDEPARLTGQIDTCAAIAAQARILDVGIPAHVDAAVAAELRAGLSAVPAPA
jgi:hypothetical protein